MLARKVLRGGLGRLLPQPVLQMGKLRHERLAQGCVGNSRQNQDSRSPVLRRGAALAGISPRAPPSQEGRLMPLQGAGKEGPRAGAGDRASRPHVALLPAAQP